MKQSKVGENLFFCEHCKVDMNIGSGGKDDLKKHIKSKKHAQSVTANTSSSSISKCYPSSEDHLVINAVLFTQFLIDNNLPLEESDKYTKLVKFMFPKCEVMQKYQRGRTNTTAIAHSSIARDSMSALADELKNTVFSLSTDGSNKIDAKLCPIVIRALDSVDGEIRIKLLCLPELTGSSTAGNISALIMAQLDRFSIPRSKCIAFIVHTTAMLCLGSMVV